MVDGVIFDMDGLMFDSERVWGTLWEPALRHFGKPVLPGLVEGARGTTGDAVLNLLSRLYGDSIDPVAVFAEFYRLAGERFAAGVPKKDGLDSLLAWLSERGVPMAVASSSPLPMIQNNLEKAQVERFFAHVVSGQEVAHSKPAPDIFLEAARRLGTSPARTLVLEDSFAGVRAGRAGGFVTVMVPDTMEPTDEILGLCDACCKSLFDVQAMLEAGKL